MVKKAETARRVGGHKVGPTLVMDKNTSRLASGLVAHGTEQGLEDRTKGSMRGMLTPALTMRQGNMPKRIMCPLGGNDPKVTKVVPKIPPKSSQRGPP